MAGGSWLRTNRLVADYTLHCLQGRLLRYRCYAPFFILAKRNVGASPAGDRALKLDAMVCCSIQTVVGIPALIACTAGSYGQYCDASVVL